MAHSPVRLDVATVVLIDVATAARLLVLAPYGVPQVPSADD